MNSKIFVLILMLTATLSVSAQKYFTKTGTTSFKAGTALEDIDAINKSTTAVFDGATGAIEFAVLVKGFEFKRGLMQEHFNENYMESEKFQKATFKGNITNLDKIDFKKDGSYSATVKGTLDMHGVKKEVEVAGLFTVVNGVVSSKADFKVLLADYNIAIPGAVKDKISPTVDIHTDCSYKPLN